MSAFIRFTTIAATLLYFNAYGQSAAVRGGLVGAAKAMTEMADRQLDMQAELELSRKKAELELEMRLRLLKAQQGHTSQVPALPQESEEVKLARLHPQWVRIITSNAFKIWLSNQLPQYAGTCTSTTAGDVMAACINDFFDKPTPPQR